MKQCLPNTRKGFQCKRDAIYNHNYCYQHTDSEPPTIQVKQKIKIRVLPQPLTDDMWIASLVDGNIDQIHRHMSVYNINQKYTINDEPIYPLFLLHREGFFNVIDTLIDSMTIDINILDRYNENLLNAMVSYGTRCPTQLRLKIIKILDRQNFVIYPERKPFSLLFNFLFSTYRDPDKYLCGGVLLGYPRIDINRKETILHQISQLKGILSSYYLIR